MTSLVLQSRWIQPLPPSFRSILDPVLGPIIADCTAIAAAFTPPSVHLLLLSRRLADDDSGGEPSLQQRAAVLEVIANVIR